MDTKRAVPRHHVTYGTTLFLYPVCYREGNMTNLITQNSFKTFA